MTLHRSLFLALAAGLGLLQAGCLAQSGDVDVDGIHGVGFGTLGDDDDDDGADPGGQTGTNGLLTTYFHAHKATIRNALGLQLANGNDLNAHVEVLLASGESGRKAFAYTAKCALDTDTTVQFATDVYEGGGLLSTTQAWTGAGLGNQAQLDTFACLAAHLNPSGAEVPIMLAGPTITAPAQPASDASSYTFDEALWAAEYGSSGALILHIWPLGDLVDKCTESVTDVMLTRVCGNGVVDCGAVVHDSATELASCTESSPGVYTSCNGMSVIQSWLKPADVDTLYGICEPRPGQ